MKFRKKKSTAPSFIGGTPPGVASFNVEAVKSAIESPTYNKHDPEDAKNIADVAFQSDYEDDNDSVLMSKEFERMASSPQSVDTWQSFFDENKRLLQTNSTISRSLDIDLFALCHFTDQKYSYKSSKGDILEAMKVPQSVKEACEQIKGIPEISKALPPSFQTYATLSYQPDQYYSGTLVWPGIPPSSLTKIVQDNVAPNMVIGLRVDDVVAFSDVSEQAWMPGWKILPRFSQEMTGELKNRIREAEYFLQNGSLNGITSSERRMNRLMPFRNFLASITRDTLVYDGIAIWTHRDKSGRVQNFAPVSASNIRLVNTEIGYLGDKNIFAVGVDEIGNPVNTFTADQLYWFVRNPRLNVEVHGYGLSEVQVAIELITGFSNVMTMNSARFTTSSIPNGIMLIQGAGNQRTIDALQRSIINFTRGPSRRWVMPVLASSTDTDIKIIDLTAYAGMETLYPDYMNMLMGALSVVYRIPIDRLGYRPSGKISEPKSKGESQGSRQSEIVDKSPDVGKIALLNALEYVVNDALIWPTFPDLIFKFMGKNPIEDARQYQERLSTMTYGERRSTVGLQPLTEVIKNMKFPDDEMKEAAEKVALILSMAPGDPSLSGIYQSILAGQGMAGNKQQQAGPKSGMPDSMYDRKKDPAASEDKGYISGVPAPTRPAQDKKPKEPADPTQRKDTK